jgi:O-antigen ligase
MSFIKQKIHIEYILAWLLRLFLFVLPWPTIWLYREVYINGYKWEYGTLGFYATEGLLWVSVVLFLIWFFKKRQLEIKNWKLEISKDRVFVASVLLFTVYVLLSSFWAIDHDIAWQQGIHIMEACLLFFMLSLGPLRAKSVAKWFVGGMAVQSVLALYQFLTQSTFAFKWLGLVSHAGESGGSSVIVNESGRWLRAYGAFSHPNVLGGFLVVSIGILLVLKYIHSDKFPFWVLQGVLAVQLVALFFTGSRSAWLSVAMMILVYVFVYFHSSFKRKKSLVQDVLVLVLLPLIFIGIFFPLVQTRLFGGSVYEVRSITERVDGYGEAYALFLGHPFFGVGAGNYTAAVYLKNSDMPGWVYQPVHAVPLLVLVELGLFGVGLLLLLFLLYIYVFVSHRFKTYMFFCVILFFPLLAFDHYFYSSYQGLMLFSIVLSFLSRPCSRRAG